MLNRRGRANDEFRRQGRRISAFALGFVLVVTVLVAGAGPVAASGKGRAAKTRRSTSATGVALDLKGRIVVAGTANGRIALARYKDSGKLDRSFGDRGKVTTKLARPIRGGGRTVAIDAKGRIDVAGNRKSGFAVVRFKPSGAVDRHFGKHGVATRKVPSGSRPAANAIAVGFNNKIVVAGLGCGNAAGADTCFALTRFTPMGEVDKAFGSSGLVTTHVGTESRAYSAIVAPSGEVFASGFGDEGDPQTAGFAVVRYDGTGAVQQSVVTQFPGAVGVPVAQSLGFDTSGRNVFAAGSSNGSNFALARYDFDSLNIDPVFGGTGTPTTELGKPAAASAVATDISARPVVAGFAHDKFAVARYTTAGFLDQGFGSKGLAFTNFGKGTDYARGVATDFTRRVVAVGATGASKPQGLGRAFAIARYTKAGALDPSFSKDGRVTTSFPRR